MNKTNSPRLGRWGEGQAAQFLQQKGYTITAARWSCRFGEIDLVAENQEYLVFVEVKLRKNAVYGSGAEFVHGAKQQKLKTTAMLYLQQHPTEKQPRFDVVELLAPNGMETKAPEIRHIVDAFS